MGQEVCPAVNISPNIFLLRCHLLSVKRQLLYGGKWSLSDTETPVNSNCTPLACGEGIKVKSGIWTDVPHVNAYLAGGSSKILAVQKSHKFTDTFRFFSPSYWSSYAAYERSSIFITVQWSSQFGCCRTSNSQIRHKCTITLLCCPTWWKL